MNLNLREADTFWHQEIRDAYANGEVGRMLCTMDNTSCLAFVADNTKALQDRGIYEAALVDAYSATRTNFRAWSLDAIRFLFQIADRGKLRAAGDPMPEGESFVLYRGVAGRGRARRIAGMSWTRDLDKAWWFAKRYPHLPDPGVYQTVANAADVYCYIAGRNEDDFVYLASNWKRLKG